MKPSARAAALTLALLSCGASLNALSAVINTAPNPAPIALTRFASPAAFEAGRATAIKNANGAVDDEFISTWFGAGVLKNAQTPIIQSIDSKGAYTISFIKQNDVWTKTASVIPALAPAEALVAAPKRAARPLPQPATTKAQVYKQPAPVLNGSVAAYPPQSASSSGSAQSSDSHSQN